MKPITHSTVTECVFKYLNPNELVNKPGFVSAVTKEAHDTDYYEDLEVVDVDSGIDNPHENGIFTDDDNPRYTVQGNKMTSFNHFIDIKKGSGLYDDFDGYSYNNGSASKDQFMPATKSKERWFPAFSDKVVKALGFGLDDAIATYMADEYVHAPGQKWYKNCSPSINNYSYYKENRKFRSVEDEAKSRFPIVSFSVRTIVIKGGGIRESVFMPVDNLGRYWFDRYLESRTAKHLGPVMHAIQDASVPHHSAGYCGNWHQQYEARLDEEIKKWLMNDDFKNATHMLYKQWNDNHKEEPTVFTVDDWKLTPSPNWRIDKIITWLALNAYHSYSKTYNHFKQGNAFDVRDAKELTKKAVAVCMLAIAKTRKNERIIVHRPVRRTNEHIEGVIVRDHRVNNG